MSSSEPHALKLIHILEAAGFEARFVGGCVRDAIMGRAVHEVDLGTTATPDQVMATLEKSGIKTVTTGLAHGTVTAVVEGRGIEITTLREDIETNGRHARVTFTKDWEKDAKRRDFTLNALSREAGGKIHDTVGGWQDAHDGYIRFVGDPRERIREDYLRILRFFRFLATHGRVLPDEMALSACRDGAGHLKDLSRERIWKELKKLLAAPNPAPAWKMMQDCGVVQKFLPEAKLHRLEKLIALEKHLPKFSSDPLLRLAALVFGEKTEAEMLQQRFALSQNEARNLEFFLDFSVEKEGQITPKKLREWAYEYSLDFAGKFSLLAGVLGAHFDWDLAASVLEKTHVKSFPLKGEDVVVLGLSPGPRVGEILRQVEAWWMDREFEPDRDACLIEAKKRLNI